MHQVVFALGGHDLIVPGYPVFEVPEEQLAELFQLLQLQMSQLEVLSM